MEETINIRELNDLIASKGNFVSMIRTGMDRRIVGQKHLVDSLLIALLCNGHVLLEGVPGLAKTLAIKTLASLVNAKYHAENTAGNTRKNGTEADKRALHHLDRNANR